MEQEVSKSHYPRTKVNEQKSYTDKSCESGWIIQIKQGDNEAFKNLFMKYYSSLVNFAYSYLKSVHVAEEVVQEVFADCWENKEKLDPDKNIKTYLFQAVKFQSLDIIKHTKVKEKYAKELVLIKNNQYQPEPQLDSSGQEFINAVQKEIERLPERAQHVYVLHRKEGLTYKEIAQVMEISPKTVESLMSRALKTLRSRLDRFLAVLMMAANWLS
ncbi:MAG: RNA polymerase sigma-70 factor [Balneolaceae bacterium]